MCVSVCEVEQDNKMSASNLGIVFGPTLMRPKPTGATVSLSSLVDYPHQARIVEALIIFQHNIFISSSSPSPTSPSSTCTTQDQVCSKAIPQTVLKLLHIIVHSSCVDVPVLYELFDSLV